jgi:pimeloyl-ACP methyl ester carboxylesterase
VPSTVPLVGRDHELARCEDALQRAAGAVARSSSSSARWASARHAWSRSRSPLVIHGDEDRIVPFAVGGQASAALIPGSTLTEYRGRPTASPTPHKDQLGRDLLAFAQS